MKTLMAVWLLTAAAAQACPPLIKDYTVRWQDGLYGYQHLSYINTLCRQNGAPAVFHKHKILFGHWSLDVMGKGPVSIRVEAVVPYWHSSRRKRL